MSDLVNRLRWAATLGDLTTTSERNLMEEAAAEITRLRAALKWNIERDGDDLLICEGDHERHEGCIMQRWVKAENVAAARRDAMEEAAQIAEECYRQNGTLSKRGFPERYRAGLVAGAQAIAAAIRAALEGGKKDE